MPHQLDKGVSRLILHAAYVPAQSPQNAAFWEQYKGIPFSGNLVNADVNQMITNHTHTERDQNGEPLRVRQKIG